MKDGMRERLIAPPRDCCGVTEVDSWEDSCEDPVCFVFCCSAIIILL
jgi:hypothetical protein